MIFSDPFRRIAEDLRREIEDLTGSVGFLCRVFGRGKSSSSLRRKLAASPGKYGANAKLIQDAVGIRVVLYFPEDIKIVEEILRSKFQCDDESSMIDTPLSNVFSVTRHNLIFRIPDSLESEMKRASASDPIDSSFEVQVRTILSEGWHEVEHDLRYKRSKDWKGHDDLSRGLNGVVATLETAEWSMRKIFDDLAYRHYKDSEWEAMMHTALRMRISPPLAAEISTILDDDREVAKSFFRVNRIAIFRSLSTLAPRIPLTLDNMIYLWNYLSVGNIAVHALTPPFLVETFAAAELPRSKAWREREKDIGRTVTADGEAKASVSTSLGH